MTDGTRPEADGGVTAAAHEERVAADDAGLGLWSQIAVVARNEYRLSVRNRWLYALTALFASLSLLLSAFGGSQVGPTRVDAVVLSLVSLATYLVPLAAFVFGYDAIVGAEEDGWLDVVFALPVRRSRVVAGTYLGRAVTLTVATAVGFGLAGALLVARAGPRAFAPYAVFLLGSVGLGLAFLAVSVVASTVAGEKTTALGGTLLLWVWFVFLHDLLALGAVATLDFPGSVLSAFVLANPADVFRVLVVEQVQTTGGGLAAVFAGTGLSVPVLVAALLAWCVVPVALASRLVRRRSV